MLTYRIEKGSPLMAEEMDGNFRDLDERLKILENHLEAGEGIGKIFSQGDQLIIMGSQGTELGTFSLPKMTLSPRGTWNPEVSYLSLDLVTHAHTLYYCLKDHTSKNWEEDNSLWQQIVDFSPPITPRIIYERATLPPQEVMGKIAVLMEETGSSLIFCDGTGWQRLQKGDPL
jgi:hypothetical protein